VNIMQIGIIGYGVVGRAITATFRDHGHTVWINEKVDSVNNDAVSPRFVGKQFLIDNCEVIFICVPTPITEVRSDDMQSIYDVFEELTQLHTLFSSINHSDLPNDPVFVIKSTVTVGLTDKLSNFCFYELDVAFNPEFLRQNTSLADASAPDRIIIGTNSERAKKVLMKLYHDFDCPIFIVDTKTAELAKLFSNAFLTTKVAFSQQIRKAVTQYDLETFPYELLTSDHRIGNSHLNSDFGKIPHDSACLPKDLLALIRSLDAPNNFLNIVYDEAIVNELYFKIH